MRRKIIDDIKFVQIQITEEAHDLITKKKTRSKPIYAVVDEILDKYQERDDYKAMYETQVELTRRWKERHDEIQKKITA